MCIIITPRIMHHFFFRVGCNYSIRYTWKNEEVFICKNNLAERMSANWGKGRDDPDDEEEDAEEDESEDLDSEEND